MNDGHLHTPKERNNMENINKETMERLAEAAHKVWMEGKLRDGWTYGSITDKGKKIHSCLIPYSQLSEADRESDRDMVRGNTEHPGCGRIQYGQDGYSP